MIARIVSTIYSILPTMGLLVMVQGECARLAKSSLKF